MTKAEIIKVILGQKDDNEMRACVAKDQEYLDTATNYAYKASALREAAELLKATPEWISVNDRLPEAGIKKFLVTFEISGERTVDIARLVDGCFILSSWRVPDDIITHWMPLPELPNEDEQK